MGWISEVIGPAGGQWEADVAVGCSHVIGGTVGEREDEELMVTAVPEKVADLI